MRYIELFAGIGGFRKALDQFEHKCVWANEIDKHAIKIYNNYYGEKYEPTDIRLVREKDIPKHDLIVGGFPCQSFSIAGKRKGFEDTRGTLFFEIMRIAKFHRTQYLLLENVKGLINHENGDTFRTILATLDELGYDVWWQILNSKHFGVPQNRERVFISGVLRGSGGRQILPIRQDDKKIDGIQGQEINTITARYEGAQATGSYIIEDKLDAQKIKQINNPSFSIDRVYAYEGICPTLRTGDKNKQPKIAIPVLTPDRHEKRQNGRRFKEPGEEMFTLTAQDRHGVVVHNMQKRSKDRPSLLKNPKAGGSGHLSRTDGITYCLDTNNTMAVEIIKPIQLGQGKNTRAVKDGTLISKSDNAFTIRAGNPNRVIDIQNTRIRRLTPVEVYRLQGFCPRLPDGSFDDSFYDKAKQVASDTQIYKTAGNAVTVNVIKAIAQNITE